MLRVIRSVLKGAAAVVAVCFVTLEMLSAICIETGLVAADTPNYRMPGSRPFWIDRNPHFGMWHEPETEYVHAKSCFSVTYRTNAYGARDRARKKAGDLPRVVMLGDSFTEGYGLDRDDRTSDILEAATRREHLNFGTSGHFGPTQSWLLYKHLAKGFDHNLVILNLLPDNDFTDDDPKHAGAYPEQYRPYLERKGGGYEVVYVNADARGASERNIRREKRRFLGRLMRNFTYTANAYNYFRGLLPQLTARSADHAELGSGYSGYFDFTQAQAERLIEVLSRLLAEAEDRTVIVTLIPRPTDMATDAPSPLPPILEILKAEHQNLHIIDFREKFAAMAWKPFYRTCDGHWSPAGAKAAAEVLMADPVYREAMGLK